MKVFISADIEGCAAITSWDEVRKGGEGYQEFREQMTAEVVAACEGARAAGATDVLIKDAHESGCNLIVSRLPDYARIVRAWSGHPHVMMFGLDPSFHASVFIGYHDAAGSDGNPLAHTMNDRIASLSINGDLASEFTVNCYTAALNTVPIAFLSGDRQICAAAGKLVPGVKTLAVSEGFGRASISIAPAKAIRMIREGVEEALSSDLGANLVALPENFEVVLKFNNASDAYRSSFYPGVEHIEACTLRFVSRDYFEVLRTLRFITV